MFVIAHHTEKFKFVLEEGLQEKMVSHKLNTSVDARHSFQNTCPTPPPAAPASSWAQNCMLWAILQISEGLQRLV